MKSNEAQDKGDQHPQRDGFELEQILEALIFSAAQPLTISMMAQHLSGFDETEIKGALDVIGKLYEGRGINLVQRGETFAFRSAQEAAPYLVHQRVLQKKLSRAAMETLAIIAYHQPVTRADIETIRGVAVGKNTLDLLIEQGWVQPGRRREVPGRPLTWKTTTEFLNYFNLETLKQLPGLDELKASGLLDARPAIETIAQTGELFEEELDEPNENAYDDGDEIDAETNKDESEI